MTQNYFDIFIPHSGPTNTRILLVGEAGGEQEMQQLKPFVGESGQILINCLNRHGVSRDEVRLMNLSHFRPHSNKFENLLGTQVLQAGIKELYEYISSSRPNVIGALGAWPLTFLTGRKGIKKWRGSILPYVNDETIKVIPTVHPAAVLRERQLYPTFDQDIKRIVDDSNFPERRLPTRRFICNPRGLEAEEWTQKLLQAEYLGTDIETVKNSQRILCVGFAPDPSTAVCFVPTHEEGRRCIERILASDVDKILQFGTYDTLQLIENNGYEWNPGRKAKELDRLYFWDTLIAQHILAPELPRSLEYLTSIYTREPYYKTVGRGTIPDDEKGWSDKVDKQSLYEYNCRDCCCTIEVAQIQMKEFENEVALMPTFNFEMGMLEVANHLSAAGIPIDNQRRQFIEDTLIERWAKKQFLLNQITTFETNVRSPKLKKILYEEMGLPTRRNRDGGITTDEDAIVSLITYCKDHVSKLVRQESIVEWKLKLEACKLILEIRGIRQLLSNYILEKSKKGIPRASNDGRIRATYKVGGTETGRWSGSKFVDGTGFNPQTLPRDPVDVADEKFLLLSASKEMMRNELLVNEPDEDDDETEEQVA